MVAPLVAALLGPLAKAGMGMLAGALKAKGKQVIEEKLGVDIEDAMMTDEGRRKLKELEMQHEEFLLEAALKKSEQDLKHEQLHQADRTSARDMQNTALLQGDTFSKRFVPIFAVVFVIAGVVYLFAAPYMVDSKNANAERVMFMVIGFVISRVGQIIDFFFGSSSGSKSKDAVIAADAAKD